MGSNPIVSATINQDHAVILPTARRGTSKACGFNGMAWVSVFDRMSDQSTHESLTSMSLTYKFPS